MTSPSIPDPLRKHEIAGRVAIVNGNGGLPKIIVATKVSTAEIYLHGAHVAHFQNNGEPPLLFVSRQSHFAAGEPIRGGVPICFPWFGGRDGGPAHGLARILVWELAESSATPDGGAKLCLRVPENSMNAEWSVLKTEFVVTVADSLTMELTATNTSPDKTLEIENCLHTYFQVGDIKQVSISGMESLPFADFASGAGGTRREPENAILRVTRETNRIYPNHAGAAEIRDETLRRIIRVEKSNSQSTVVWNPWTTQKLPDDFDPAEHAQMVCVESGNVKQNKLPLAPGQAATLKVILSSAPLTNA
jgi:glucose-6-phosphate 1-epimerase